MALFATFEDHIPAQNEAGQDLAEILNHYDSGLISGAEAVRQFNVVADDFLAYTQAIGSDRALRGGREIRALADQLISGVNVSAAPSSFAGAGSFAGISYSGSEEQALSGGGIIVPFTPARGAVDTSPVRGAAAPTNGITSGQIIAAVIVLGVIYGLSKL